MQAASGDEALTVLESSVELDLVLTDIRMPGSLDGLALAERLREHWPDLPIVMVSGDLPPVPPVGLADAFLPKPYSPAAVLACINRLLSPANDQS